MVRVTSAVPSRRKKNRRFKEAKGYWGGRSRLWRTVSETLVRAHAFATAHRRRKKRDFRAQWIVRISAACEMRGYSYSQLIDGLNKAGITLNRKQLAEIALSDAGAFDKLVEEARTARQGAAAVA
jgi:large subunit ribosomal protein L20